MLNYFVLVLLAKQFIRIEFAICSNEWHQLSRAGFAKLWLPRKMEGLQMHS